MHMPEQEVLLMPFSIRDRNLCASVKYLRQRISNRIINYICVRSVLCVWQRSRPDGNHCVDGRVWYKRKSWVVGTLEKINKSGFTASMRIFFSLLQAVFVMLLVLSDYVSDCMFID